MVGRHAPSVGLYEPKRTAVNQWYANTLLSRLGDKRTGAVVIAMQRVHMDDLTGFVLGQSGDSTVPSLPIIAECAETIALTQREIHRRRAGDVLWPDREPINLLEQLRLQLGADLVPAQYQQGSVPPGGAMIKRHWVQRYAELPPAYSGSSVVQSWETAMKGPTTTGPSA